MKLISLLLLVFVLLLCVTEVQAASPQKSQKNAIAAFKKLGGDVEFDKSGKVKSINLEDTQVTDADLVYLVYLKGLPMLEKMGLTGTQVTDDGLVQLKGLTTLTELNLGNTQITDVGLVNLKGLTMLRGLGLEHSGHRRWPRPFEGINHA